MGSEIVYCNTCGGRILERDFAKGQAVTVLKKNYCCGCMEDVIQASAQGKKQDVQTEEDAPRKIRNRTQRVPPVAPRPRFKIPVPYLLAFAIGILALVLLAVSRGDR